MGIALVIGTVSNGVLGIGTFAGAFDKVPLLAGSPLPLSCAGEAAAHARATRSVPRRWRSSPCPPVRPNDC